MKKDITGIRFGRLKAIKNIKKVKNRTHWICQCDCGNKSIVEISNLTSGHTKSCGCFKTEIIKAKATKHGQNTREKISTEYKIWASIKTRCYNKNSISYKYYGARNIKMCNRWKNSFENFYKDMGKRPSNGYTIDRIDNNGDYSPKNCKWSNFYEQTRNKRNNNFIKYENQIRCLSDWAIKLGINRTTLWMRINQYNWSIKKAFTTKSKH